MDFLMALIFLLSLSITLIITVPFAGALVRFRANYNPKGLQLDAEGGAQPHTGPIVPYYFSMLLRVKRIEGWAGLFKGFMPTFGSTLFLGVLMLLTADVSNASRHGTYNTPDIGILPKLGYAILRMLIALPTVVITYRAITTPHRLPWFGLRQSLRILLTPTERKRPWTIYLTPGLLASQVVHITYVVIFLHTLRGWLLPDNYMQGVPQKEDFSVIKTSIYFVIVLFSTIILTPLEVISTRLAIQRNHASPEYNSVTQEVDGDAEDDTAEYAGAEEDVIGLRSEHEPYLGLLDCGKTIIHEEGFKALYRAWWITMIGALVGAFS